MILKEFSNFLVGLVSVQEMMSAARKLVVMYLVHNLVDLWRQFGVVRI
jgi:hypothetical protein